MYSEPALPRGDYVVVETGTNFGSSTIVMAQALKDLGLKGKVRTVDFSEVAIETAKRNVEDAGLSDDVEFNLEDSLAFLSRVAGEVEHLDFDFLDDNHEQAMS